MKTLAASTDEDLLLANTPDAFGEFYDRHARANGLFRAAHARSSGGGRSEGRDVCVGDRRVAQRRFRRGGAPATAWLFAIAARRLADYQRRGWVEERVRRSLAVERRRVSEEDAGIIALLAGEDTFELLAELPADQRDAVTGHVMEDRGYAELAADGSTSEAVVRQRVSRGLATLQRRLGPENRGAAGSSHVSPCVGACRFRRGCERLAGQSRRPDGRDGESLRGPAPSRALHRHQARRRGSGRAHDRVALSRDRSGAARRPAPRSGHVEGEASRAGFGAVRRAAPRPRVRGS